MPEDNEALNEGGSHEKGTGASVKGSHGTNLSIDANDDPGGL